MSASNSDWSHIARPYAKAAFDLAQDRDDLAGWTDQLALLAAVVDDAQMADVISSPAVSNDQLTELVLDVCGDKLTEQGQNLVKLMVRNERLQAASEISSQYQTLRDEAEQVIEAQLVTAFEVDETQKEAISAALSKRLGKTIKLVAEVDESLIGGAVVRAGDWVVDGSVKAQLSELVGALSR